MEKSPNHIDELMRHRLHDATATPPDFVWPQVEAALRKRRRRFLFFWLFGAGMLTVGALAWWQQSAAGAQQYITSRAVPMTQTNETTAAAPEQAEMPAPVSSETQRSNQENKEQEVAALAPGNTSKADPAAANSYSKQRKNTNTTAKTTQTVNTKATHLPEVTPATGASDLLTERASKTDFSDIYSPTDALPADASVHPLPATAASGTNKDDIHPSDASITRIPQLTPITLKPQIFTPYPLIVQPLYSKLLNPSVLSTAKKPLIIRKNKKETRNCYDFSEHPNVLLFDAYAGPSLARKEMITGPDNQPYLAQRRNTERRDWSFNAGLRASLLLDRHFLIRTGAHYDQINEVFEYIDPNSVEVIIRQTTQIVNGQPITVIDTLGVEYGENYLKTYNRFGMLDIPLEVGVELRNGRTGLSFNGGLALNVMFWKRGAIISPLDGRPGYFTPEKGTVDAFRTSAGLSAVGSIQWFCHLRPRWRVFAEPYVRMVLRPVNIPDHPVEQRYSLLGLKVGMTHILDLKVKK